MHDLIDDGHQGFVEYKYTKPNKVSNKQVWNPRPSSLIHLKNLSTKRLLEGVKDLGKKVVMYRGHTP